ncbi:MAG: PH domain-containing protein [Gammaproteobacteria bacterium]|nr:PH domain-containing protein [Gammaproteobacteria bacterium]
MSSQDDLTCPAVSGPPANEESWSRLSSKYVLVKVLRVIISSVFVVAPLLFGLGLLVLWSYSLNKQAALVGAGIFWAIQLVWRLSHSPIEVRKTRFSVFDDCFWYKGGVWGRWEEVIPFSRVQQVSSASRPLDRLMGVRSVEIETADGTTTSIDGLDIELSEKLRDFVARQIEAPLKKADHEFKTARETQIAPTDVTIQRDGLVKVESLPKPDLVRWLKFRCHLRNIIGRLPMSLVGYPVALMFLLVFFSMFTNNYDLLGNIFLITWLSIACITLVYPLIEVSLRRIALRTEDVVFRKGVFTRRTRIMPFACVQNVELSQGLIDRRFGLSNLSIYMPGSNTTINGLDKSTADYLRTEILEHASL